MVLHAAILCALDIDEMVLFWMLVIQQTLKLYGYFRREIRTQVFEVPCYFHLLINSVLDQPRVTQDHSTCFLLEYARELHIIALRKKKKG